MATTAGQFKLAFGFIFSFYNSVTNALLGNYISYLWKPKKTVYFPRISALLTPRFSTIAFSLTFFRANPRFEKNLFYSSLPELEMFLFSYWTDDVKNIHMYTYL